MNHVSRRSSRVYDIHEEKTFICRVDFQYNGQWSPDSPETDDIVSENASGNSENDGQDKDNKAKEHRILRFYDEYSFTFYSVFIREGQGSLNQ